MSIVKIWINEDMYDAESVMVFRKLRKPIESRETGEELTHLMIIKVTYSLHPDAGAPRIFLTKEQSREVSEKIKLLDSLIKEAKKTDEEKHATV